LCGPRDPASSVLIDPRPSSVRILTGLSSDVKHSQYTSALAVLFKLKPKSPAACQRSAHGRHGLKTTEKRNEPCSGRRGSDAMKRHSLWLLALLLLATALRSRGLGASSTGSQAWPQPPPRPSTLFRYGTLRHHGCMPYPYPARDPTSSVGQWLERNADLSIGDRHARSSDRRLASGHRPSG
jgi:hypothetical protein